MDNKEKEEIINWPEGTLSLLHFSLGTFIRNSFGLWDENSELIQSFADKFIHPDDVSSKIVDGLNDKKSELMKSFRAKLIDPDDVSSKIIDALWTRLQEDSKT